MSTRISGSRIGATAAISQGSRVRRYQSGRICGHSECDTVLSVYNPSRYCAVHAQLGIGRRRRGVEHRTVEVACAHCGSQFETANTHRKFCSDRCRMAAFARRKRAALRAERLQREAMATAPEERDAVVSAA